MIHIIITSYGEVNSTEKAISSFLKQNIEQDYKIIVSDPFTETKWMIEEKFPNQPVEYFEDLGEGKSKALNLILKQIYSDNKEDIIISTDGDVYVSENSVREILKIFKDESIGIVCGHPVSLNPRNDKFGYWSHLLFDEMNKTRKKLFSNKEFFEVSGYLFGMRNGVIKQFQVNASEDNVIPILFWQKDYKIGYAENALVYVMNPQDCKDWMVKKKRNIKGHIALENLFENIPKRKNTMFAEAKRGLKIMFSYPQNPKEFFWTIGLMRARLQAWKLAKKESRASQYQDGWRGEAETPTTRTLD